MISNSKACLSHTGPSVQPLFVTDCFSSCLIKAPSQLSPLCSDWPLLESCPSRDLHLLQRLHQQTKFSLVFYSKCQLLNHIRTSSSQNPTQNMSADNANDTWKNLSSILINQGYRTDSWWLCVTIWHQLFGEEEKKMSPSVKSRLKPWVLTRR